MTRKHAVALACCLVAGAARANTQHYMQGWDVFGGQLDYANSTVVWTLDTATRDFTVTYNLIGAQPNFLYQAGVHFACTTDPGVFGRFPTDNQNSGKPCSTITRQNVTATGTATEFGAVLTDSTGKGSLTVDVGPLAAGKYHLEFDLRDGAGCGLIGGNSGACGVIFQSPGPFGTPTNFTVP